MKGLINTAKTIVLFPAYVALLWLVAAGVFQTYEMYHWSSEKLEQINNVRRAASNPLSLLRKED